MLTGRVAIQEPKQDLTGAATTLPQPYQSYESAVGLFLRENPSLLTTLHDASPIIQTHFPNTPVVLTVTEDPESLDPATTRRLVARIQSALPPAKAVAQLNRSDEAWWLDISHTAGDQLVITLG